MKVSTKILGAAAAGALALSVAAPAGAATGPGSAKLALKGPEAVIYCADLVPTGYEVADTTISGFAIFNQADGQVKATVSLKGAEPNTEYPIRLIQAVPDLSQCYTVDAVLTTNGQGNGTVNVKEAIAGTAVQVIIDTHEIFGTPTYRATEAYVLR